MIRTWTVESFADHFMSRPVAKLFRCVNGTWFMFMEGHWTVDYGGVSMNHAIMGEVDDVNWQGGKKQYIHDRIRQRLRAYLNCDKLPGRLEP